MQELIQFFQQAWARELALGIVIFLIVVLYYFRYVHFAKKRDSRHHRRQLRALIVDTRWLVLALIVVLVGMIGFDRFVLPHAATTPARQSASGSKQATPTKTSTVPKKAASSAKTKTSASSSTSSASSASSGSLIAATPRALSTAQYQALQVVKQYYAAQPDATGHADTYRYRRETTDHDGNAVTEIGGYTPVGTTQLRQTHLYWVYPSGRFTLAD